MSSQWLMAIRRTHMVFGKFKNVQTDCTAVQLTQNIRWREKREKQILRGKARLKRGIPTRKQDPRQAGLPKLGGEEQNRAGS